MKLREETIDYSVIRHGSEYVEEIEPSQVFPCPECLSTDVREIGDDDDTCADFICNSCGCGFDACNYYKRTKAGNALSLFLKILIGMFVGVALILLFGGLIWLAYERRKFGEEPLPNEYTGIAITISVAGPMVCMFIIMLLSTIDDKI